MADKLPRSILLPETPLPREIGGEEGQPIGPEYVQRLTDALKSNHTQMAERIEELIETGDAADRPDATGAGRFFYEEDTSILKIDDGAWDAVGGSGVLSGYLPLSAGASYPLTGDLYLDTNINIRLKNAAALMGADSNGDYLDIMYITR